jgi:hypothetical protein
MALDENDKFPNQGQENAETTQGEESGKWIGSFHRHEGPNLLN